MTLPSGERAGFFIGDAAGVGKGRQAGYLLVDNNSVLGVEIDDLSLSHFPPLPLPLPPPSLACPLSLPLSSPFSPLSALYPLSPLSW